MQQLATQQNNGLVVNNQSRMPALPQDILNVFAGAFDEVLDKANGAFNRIALSGKTFNVIEAGAITQTLHGALNMVILHVEDMHHIWYAAEFNDRTEDGPPDAIWGVDEQVPSNVPAEALLKDDKGATQKSTIPKVKWRRRIAVALANIDATGNIVGLDLDKIYTLEINSMSLFGESIKLPSHPGGQTGGEAYNFQTLLATFKAKKFYPCATVVTAIFDPSKSVPVLRFVPRATVDGQIIPLANEQLAAVANTIATQDLAKLTDWRQFASSQQQIGTPTAQAQQAAQAPVPQPVTPAPQPVQQQQHNPYMQQAATQPVQQATQPVQQATQAAYTPPPPPVAEYAQQAAATPSSLDDTLQAGVPGLDLDLSAMDDIDNLIG